MKHLLLCATALFTLSLCSCKKDIEEIPTAPDTPFTTTPPAAFAAYKLILTGSWTAPGHTVPSGNHFTRFNGMVHGNSSFLFRTGVTATLGVENVAEVGNDVVLENEMDNFISTGSALNKFKLNLPSITATDSTVVNLTSGQSLISFISMIAPSPDWFAGLDSYNLLQNGKWVDDIIITIKGYDAGTEDGDVFGYNNPATSPQQNIVLMTPFNASVIANGNSGVAPFATLRCIRL